MRHKNPGGRGVRRLCWRGEEEISVFTKQNKFILRYIARSQNSIILFQPMCIVVYSV